MITPSPHGRTHSLWGIVMSTAMCLAVFSTCTQASYPTYRHRNEAPVQTPDVISAISMNDYDTIITPRGDTTVLKVPYKPSTLEKAGFFVMAAFVYWCIDQTGSYKD